MADLSTSLIAFLYGVFLRLLELDGDTVDAVPESGGGRAVVEDVTEVGVASSALNLNSPHTMTIVRLLGHVINLVAATGPFGLFQGGTKTGPAASSLKLRF